MYKLHQCKKLITNLEEQTNYAIKHNLLQLKVDIISSTFNPASIFK